MSVNSEKCHACGANLTFNPQKQKWICNYCGESYTLTDLENYKKMNQRQLQQIDQNITNITVKTVAHKL